MSESLYTKEIILKQLNNHLDNKNLYGLTEGSENNPFSNTFYYFILYFLGENIASNSSLFWVVKNIEKNLKKQIKNTSIKTFETKKFQQLFFFNCSALYSLNNSEYNELIFRGLENFYSFYKTKNIVDIDTLKGKPGSGNFAMFKGITLSSLKFLFGCDYVTSFLDEWITKHLQYMHPKTGLWSIYNSPSIGAIQNSYHQYEVFDFLEKNKYIKIDWNPAAKSVLTCCDSKGAFAPFSGGGACYDYDSIFLLSKNSDLLNKYIKKYRKSNLILKNFEGYKKYMFCESLYKPNVFHIMKDIFVSRNNLIALERLKFNLALMIKGESIIKPHWDTSNNFSIYKPDLWSIWFRLLTFKRILFATKSLPKDQINGLYFPGIGQSIF